MTYTENTDKNAHKFVHTDLKTKVDQAVNILVMIAMPGMALQYGYEMAKDYFYSDGYQCNTRKRIGNDCDEYDEIQENNFGLLEYLFGYDEF